MKPTYQDRRYNTVYVDLQLSDEQVYHDSAIRRSDCYNTVYSIGQNSFSSISALKASLKLLFLLFERTKEYPELMALPSKISRIISICDRYDLNLVDESSTLLCEEV